jgi:hypothetical protein
MIIYKYRLVNQILICILITPNIIIECSFIKKLLSFRLFVNIKKNFF